LLAGQLVVCGVRVQVSERVGDGCGYWYGCPVGQKEGGFGVAVDGVGCVGGDVVVEVVGEV